jgi:GNAT superfamily N-acetyltransferase
VERHDDVVDALCDAFHDYPVMRFVLTDSGEHYVARLRRLVGYLTMSRFCRGCPVLGVEGKGRLVAAANVNPPTPTPTPDTLLQLYRDLAAEIGTEAIRRFEAFGAICEPLLPDVPHYYLGMIGVRPGEQGHGYARLLLDALHGMSERDASSRGVVLTTETPDNLPFYEHFGYRVLGEGRTEELRSWTLFRPDPA